MKQQLTKRKNTESELKKSYRKLEMSRLATLNLMEDLKTEFEQHKKSQEILLESQSKYKELFTLFRTISDNMTDMLWAKDLDRRYIFANKAMCDRLLIANNTEEPVGESDLFFALRERNKHPDDPAWHTFGEICSDSDQVVIDSGKSAQFDEYGNVKGKFLYLDVRKSPLYNDSGIMLGTVGSARDITYEKEAEDALRKSEYLLRESQIIAGLGSYVLDIPSGNWTSSSVLNTVFGISDTYDHSVEGWEALVHPDYRKEMSAYFSEEVLKKRIKFDKEYKIIRNNDKAERWVHGLGKLEEDDQGQLVKMYGTIQDITKEKQIQDEINQLNNELEKRVFERTAQLEEANRELEAFSYSVSHDLRAPIRAIHGFTHILLEDYLPNLDEEGKRVCAIIQENAVKMGQLVDDLLKFSQLNRADIQFSVIDMNNLGNAIYSELTTPERRQEIDFQIGIVHPAWGDQLLLRQVWTNLISNALKFSSRSTNVRIRISSEKQNDFVVYCIQDNGAGFNMKYKDKLFGVFQRLHSSKEFEGTGVGLAIVQRIIHRHGGKVWGEGETNQGASFYFSLPVRKNTNKQ
jgi:signal transduction histidine kinase